MPIEKLSVDQRVEIVLAKTDWARTGSYAERGGTIKAPWGNTRPDEIRVLMGLMNEKETLNGVFAKIKSGVLSGDREAVGRAHFLAAEFFEFGNQFSQDRDLLGTAQGRQIASTARKSWFMIDRRMELDAIDHALENPKRLGQHS